MRNVPILAAAAALLAASLPAAASSSAWHDSEGGRVRLVTSGRPDAQGRLQGVLDIALKPGWKTYWRDPGDNGVPPQLGIAESTNVVGAEMAFPAPQRHDDGYGQWAGYDGSVSLPVTFRLASPQDRAVIDAQVFIGICETICIPVKASLTVDRPPTRQRRRRTGGGSRAGPCRPRRTGSGHCQLGGDHEPGGRSHARAIPDGRSLHRRRGRLHVRHPVRRESAGKLVFSVPISTGRHEAGMAACTIR